MRQRILRTDAGTQGKHGLQSRVDRAEGALRCVGQGRMDVGGNLLGSALHWEEEIADGMRQKAIPKLCRSELASRSFDI